MASYKDFVESLRERLENLKGLNAEMTQLQCHLRHIDTASDFLNLVRCEARALYELTGNKLAQSIQAYFDPNQLLKEGILINPDVLPKDKYIGFTVFYTQPHELTVDYRQRMDVYGDVKLNVLKGNVYVHDSKLPCEAFGVSSVIAHGQTSVIAHDETSVTLHDRSRCLALDQSKIKALDSSFVEAQDEADVVVKDYGQILITKGSPHVELEDQGRGYIHLTEPGELPVRMTLVGRSLLYATCTYEHKLQLTPYHHSGLIIRGEKHDMALREAMRDMIVPQHKGSIFEEKPLWAALDVAQIKADLQRYMPASLEDSARESYTQAKDEKELCAWVSKHFDALENNGLNGSFLRTHFTKDTLESYGLFAFNRSGMVRTKVDYSAYRYFSDQYVPDHNGGKLYEQALGSANNIELHHEAMAVGLESNNLTAKDHASVICLDKSHVQLHGYASGRLYQEAASFADENARLYLCGKNLAILSGHCVALSDGMSFVRSGKFVGRNFVENDDPVTVGVVTNVASSQKGTIIRNPSMKVVELPDEAHYQRFVDSYMKDGQQRHTGLRR